MPRLNVFTLCLVILIGVRAGCGEGQPVDPAPQLNADAVAIVRAAVEYLHAAKSYSVGLTHKSAISGSPDYNKEYTMKYDLAIELPNKLALAIKEGDLRCSLFSDGQTLWKSAPKLKEYTQEAAPKTLAMIFDVDEIQFVREDLSFLFFLDNFAMPNALDVILGGVTKLKLYGVEKLGDTQSYHLHFSEKDLEWDMWVQEGKLPILRKVSFEGERTINDGKSAPVKLNKLVQTTYEDWKFNESIPAARFAFTPGADFKKVESFVEKPYDPKLLGEPAPPLASKLLEGGTFDLASMKGKQPVLVEFWATWCGPCRKSMPIVSEICDLYRPKGVASYAVNLKETPAKIKEYKAGTSALTMPIILDEEGTIAKAYRVQSIPMVVLIGKNGIVEALYLGLPNNLPAFKANLKAQLDALIEGQSLVKPAGEKKVEAPKSTENAKGEPEAK